MTTAPPVSGPTTTAAPVPTTTAAPTGPVIAKYGQCGGKGYTGGTVCATGSTCTVQSEFYSQCL